VACAIPRLAEGVCIPGKNNTERFIAILLRAYLSLNAVIRYGPLPTPRLPSPALPAIQAFPIQDAIAITVARLP
jgi:hypothetical protein